MDEPTFYVWLLRGWLALAALVAVALLAVQAPYGRYARAGWGPTVGATLGWVLMELPAVLVPAILFVAGGRFTGAAITFIVMWQLHYLQRTFIFPFRLRGAGRRTPWSVIAMAACFNVVNGYLNGRVLFTLGPEHPTSWLYSPPFLIGALIFASGMAIHLHSDALLRRLRPADENRSPASERYRIPHGGLFRWISCPNYLGEILEWIGWAIATGTLAGWSFAAWTAANLVPRAIAHHRWYRQHFPDYPRQRKALIPWLL